jgi:hypothetical protein
MSDDASTLKLSLKPRCNLGDTVAQFQSIADTITAVEMNIWKKFFEEALEDDLDQLFTAVGELPEIKSLTLSSKGTNIQSVPALMLALTIAGAKGLEVLHLNHIRVSGDIQSLEGAFVDHECLKVLKLECEDMDVLEQAIAAAGQIPSLEVCHIESATIAQKLAEPSESLCWSKSLRELILINVAESLGDLFDVYSLLAVNQVLQELTLQVSVFDAKGGEEVVKMLTYNKSLKKLVLKAERMDGKDGSLGTAFIAALDKNDTIDYFQIILDGRQSDMKVVRAMGVAFRDALKGKFKCTPKAGMSMGVICEREYAEE